MTRRKGPPEPADHPLAGILEKLLARERGEDRRPREEGDETPIPSVAEVTGPWIAPHAMRRMLVIAGLGADEGRAALREVARWGLRNGRRPAVLELACGGPAPENDAHCVPPAPDAPRLPLACVPCGPARLRLEPPEVVAELLERLRRHEMASDLLLVRIPPRHRTVLMRAAFLAGRIIVPLDDSDSVLDEAFRLSREIVDSFLDLALWPFADRPQALERYMAMVRDFLGVRPQAFDADMDEAAAILDRLPGAPEEGFLTALVAPDEAAPPVQLLQTGFLRL